MLRILKSTITESIKPFLREFYEWIMKISIEKASKEQGLETLANELRKIVPDITNQYSLFKVDNPYIAVKVRNQHAFQISLVNDIIGEIDKPTIIDIGDSAGTHLQYIMGLHSKNKDIKCLSVNLDDQAVRKIKEKGLEAVNARAEDLHKYNINPDIFLCFEILEHLMNPSYFLYELSTKTNAKYLIITVPYLKNSRVGLHHIRRGVIGNIYAENTHIFELSPKDWKLLVKHSGWNISKERIYFQYPLKGFLRITKPLWKYRDFEGFYGMVLTRDNTWSSQYMHW
jgi:2-polyprenyl-3-methyl-5-hydroxy-6-metoxy-1,4-benzoquinol methylase